MISKSTRLSFALFYGWHAPHYIHYVVCARYTYHLMSTITRETTSNRHTNENHYLCGGNNLIVQYALHIIFSTQRVNISTYISHNHYHIHAGINIWYTHILYLFVLVSFFFWKNTAISCLACFSACWQQLYTYTIV